MRHSVAILSYAYSVAFSAICYAGFSDLNPRFDFSLGDSNGMPEDVVDTTGQITSSDGKSVKLFGTMGPLDGERFRQNFVLYFDGLYEGTLHTGGTIVADLNFTVTVSGGELAWRFHSDLWNGDYARISTDLMPMSSGVPQLAHFESTSLAADSMSGIFSGYLLVDWTNRSPTDTFLIEIPEHSIDIALVPEPNVLVLLAVCMASLSCHGRMTR